MTEDKNDIIVTGAGTLTFRGQAYRCALGGQGVRADRREGDQTTPVGRFPIREILYRADRVVRPDSPFPTTMIKEGDAWCCDPEDVRYNTKIAIERTEKRQGLWRTDHVFDVIAVLGFNDDPVVPGRGSGIFMHSAREGYTPTQGCVALSLPDLLLVLRACTKETHVCVVP